MRNLSGPFYSASKTSKLSNVGGCGSACFFNRCICQIWVTTKSVSSLKWSSPILLLSGFPFLFMANFILLTPSPTLFAAVHAYTQGWKMEVIQGSKTLRCCFQVLFMFIKLSQLISLFFCLPTLPNTSLGNNEIIQITEKQISDPICLGRQAKEGNTS